MQDHRTDWHAWHADYTNPASGLSQRLATLRRHLADAISAAPAGAVRVLSLCAGQGQDVLGVLPAHPRRADVSAVLVEYDARNVALARDAAADVPEVEVREDDASRAASFADVLPADVLLLCGIFGNISDADIRNTVHAAATICAPGATVLWTRHRRPPDITPAVRRWFEEAGFDEVAFVPIDAGDKLLSVGVNRLSVPQDSAPTDTPLFTFIR